MDALKTNNVKIVGRVASVNLKEGKKKTNGQGYISGTVTLNSLIGGEKKEFEINLYANETTKEGKPNQLYVSYSKLSELVGKKVEISGELRENRYFSTNAKQLVSAQQIAGRFVRGVSDTTEDLATFELGGFIVSELVQKTNKNGEIYRYDIVLGQGNYNNTNMSMFTLHVRPTDVEIINGLKGQYHAGDTVVLNGQLDWIIQTVVRESDNVGFGSGAVHTFTNRQRNFWISGGSVVIKDAEKGAYDQEIIRTLIAAYKAHDVELANAAPSDGGSTVEDKPTVTGRQTSLI